MPLLCCLVRTRRSRGQDERVVRVVVSPLDYRDTASSGTLEVWAPPGRLVSVSGPRECVVEHARGSALCLMISLFGGDELPCILSVDSGVTPDSRRWS